MVRENRGANGEVKLVGGGRKEKCFCGMPAEER